MTPTPQEFFRWEIAARDTIDLKKIYVDMAGDLVAGVVLSQVVYWHLPDRDGQTRLRVQKEGYLWVAKKADDWYDECRTSPKQLSRALKKLEEQFLIVTGLWKFAGAPTKHVRIDWVGFLDAWEANLPKGTIPFDPLVEMDFTEREKSLTESTTETTDNKPPVDPPQERTVSDSEWYKTSFALDLCEVTGDNFDIDRTRKTAGRVSGQLIKAGYIIDDIATFRAWWYAKDWRGQKGQPPTLNQALDAFAKAFAEDQPQYTRPGDRRTDRKELSPQEQARLRDRLQGGK